MLREEAQATTEEIRAFHGDHGNGEFHHHHSHSATSQHASSHHLLQVESLSVAFQMYEESVGLRGFFQAPQRSVQVIRDLSISVHVGEVVAVVGASGSGKTLLADALFGLFQPNAQVSGTIWFDGEEQTPASLAALRGNRIALIPQSIAALDPLMKVGHQVQGFAKGSEGRQTLQERQEELFARYGLSPEVAGLYPHELSGGMARRVLLCCALMGHPQLIVADEPTPGLDTPLAVQALSDLRSFADDGGGVMLITHDLDLALQVADRVAVFREGTVVEETSVAAFADPTLLRHPFSRALWRGMPEHGFEGDWEEEADHA